MKKKFTALKMYLVGLTAGLFVFGWSAIAQSDVVAQTNSTQSTVSQATTSQSTSKTAVQSSTTAQATTSQTTNVRTVTSQPRIRTRSS